MKWLKKVAATPLTSIARVIDSLDNTENERTNAPSIRAVRDAVSEAGQFVYPIGSIYMSVNNVNPHDIFGGTWVKIKDKFLLASGDTYTNGATGGEAEHTLTTDEMPSHTHNVIGDSVLPSGSSIAVDPQDVGCEAGMHTASFCSGGISGINIEGEAQSTGGGLSHNNLPPYLVVNVWYRTA